jgi:hypothetical protein
MTFNLQPHYSDHTAGPAAARLTSEHWIGLLSGVQSASGSRSSGKAQPDQAGMTRRVPAELIGRTGYPLYR